MYLFNHYVLRIPFAPEMGLPNELPSESENGDLRALHFKGMEQRYFGTLPHQLPTTISTIQELQVAALECQVSELRSYWGGIELYGKPYLESFSEETVECVSNQVMSFLSMQQVSPKAIASTNTALKLFYSLFPAVLADRTINLNQLSMQTLIALLHAEGTEERREEISLLLEAKVLELPISPKPEIRNRADSALFALLKRNPTLPQERLVPLLKRLNCYQFMLMMHYKEAGADSASLRTAFRTIYDGLSESEQAKLCSIAKTHVPNRGERSGARESILALGPELLEKLGIQWRELCESDPFSIMYSAKEGSVEYDEIRALWAKKVNLHNKKHLK